jgi:hypothetical protein
MKVKFNLKKVEVKIPEQADVIIEGIEYEFEGNASEIKESVNVMVEMFKLQAEMNSAPTPNYSFTTTRPTNDEAKTSQDRELSRV